MSTEPRHQFYETDNDVKVTIFIKGAKPEDVTVEYTQSSATFKHGDHLLQLKPLKARIAPDQSTYRVGNFNIELTLRKEVAGRWGGLVSDGEEAPLIPPLASSSTPAAVSTSDEPAHKKHKNWEKLADTELTKEKEKSLSDDPNAGGDVALNGFFQQIYSGADDDARRAMMKSFVESNGTALSTNWDEVKKGKVETKPPSGQEEKKYK